MAAIQDVTFDAEVTLALHDDGWMTPDITVEIMGRRYVLHELPRLLRNDIVAEAKMNVDHEKWEITG